VMRRIKELIFTLFAPKGNPGLWLLFCCLLAGFVAGLAACAKAPSPSASRPEPLLSQEQPFGPSSTLDEYVRRLLASQYPLPRVEYPIPEASSPHFMELVHEPVHLHLASTVSSHVLGADKGDHSLAVGLLNGDIRVWSRWPCPTLTLPDQMSASVLAWDGQSPFLGAGNTRDGKLHVYDLRHCARLASLPGIGESARNARSTGLRAAAISPSSGWVALVDGGQGLHAGPLRGPWEHVASFRFPPLALAFSPREGVLHGVDQAGWLILWTVPDLRELERVLIPGGPFEAALFHGQFLSLKAMVAKPSLPGRAQSPVITWDIPEGRLAGQDALQQTLDLFTGLAQDDGLLSLRTPEKHWVRKLHLGPARLAAHVSPALNLLRITEPDRALHWYDAASGLPVDAPETEPGDLRSLPVQANGMLQWRGAAYFLADPVLHRDHHLLLARHSPDGRYFLWWKGIDQDWTGALPPKPGLPVRTGLLQERPADWIEMNMKPQAISGETP